MADNFLVIFALLFTSVVVRVLPSLLTINFGAKAQHLIEEVLPTSIFICFITYIVMPEIASGLNLSIFSFIAVGILAAWPQKLSATPELSAKVFPYVIHRTQH